MEVDVFIKVSKDKELLLSELKYMYHPKTRGMEYQNYNQRISLKVARPLPELN